MITVSEAKQNITRSIETARVTNDFSEVKKLGKEYLEIFDNYDYRVFNKWWNSLRIDNLDKPKKAVKLKVVDETWMHTKPSDLIVGSFYRTVWQSHHKIKFKLLEVKESRCLLESSGLKQFWTDVSVLRIGLK